MKSDLRAALRERDTFKEAYETMQVLKEGVSEANEALRSDLASALRERDDYKLLYEHALAHEATDHEARRDAEQERDEARGQLCRAREQLKIACKYLMNSGETMASLEKIMHEINALSSSAPCPHAERVKMLEEGWLHLTRQTPPETNHPGDTVSQEVQIKGTAKYHYPTDRWCQVYASWKPIRRRAGVEGK